METSRNAGILLHPTSLPGNFGIGDFGDDAESFLGWLSSAGQKIWQILPLGPVGLGNSPYGAQSSFAGNPMLVSPKRLLDDGLIDRSDFDAAVVPETGHADFHHAETVKERMLRRAFERLPQSSPDVRHGFDAFVAAEEQREWLADWALFSALKQRFHGREWTSWDVELRRRDPSAIEAAWRELDKEIRYHEFVQFIFLRQWLRLRESARNRHIRIMGDLPIYVALDSADAWANQELFHLDEERRPIAVAGVPPDYFSKTGQRWGNPLYRWDRMKEQGYRWWIARLRANLRLADLVRIDHFRGFAGYWEIPAHEETAIHGKWVTGPGADFFNAVRNAFGGLPFVAEDLGVITEDVEQLRRQFSLPGMKVLQFGFGSVDNIHLPHHYEKNMIAYTGTHDNDTTRGWFDATAHDERRRVLDYLGCGERDVVRALVRVAYQSIADTAIIPFQDVVESGSEARMNVPGEAANNWSWRAKGDQFRQDDAERLRKMAELTGRVRS